MQTVTKGIRIEQEITPGTFYTELLLFIGLSLGLESRMEAIVLGSVLDSPENAHAKERGYVEFGICKNTVMEKLGITESSYRYIVKKIVKNARLEKAVFKKSGEGEYTCRGCYALPTRLAWNGNETYGYGRTKIIFDITSNWKKIKRKQL